MRRLRGRRAFLLSLTASAYSLWARNISGPGLRERAAAKNLLYGAAGSHSALSNDFDYAVAFARECGILAPEIALKWKALRPTPDRLISFRPTGCTTSRTVTA